ncbi:hypothetical protein KI387_040763, partial [Taxus chinensis]
LRITSCRQKSPMLWASLLPSLSADVIPWKPSRFRWLAKSKTRNLHLRPSRIKE